MGQEGTEKGLFSEMRIALIFIYSGKYFLSGNKKGKNKGLYAAFISISLIILLVLTTKAEK
jgi:hypothetical protein